jgi:hypothetical protein
MAEEKKKSSWGFPGAGPGTLSGFFVAWVFVGAIIGIAVFFMSVGKGPLPLRIAGYDIGATGGSPTPAEMDRLVAAIRQTNSMILVLHGGSEKVIGEVARRLEVKAENMTSGGGSAILSRYAVEKSQSGRTVLIHFAKIGKFGIVSVDLKEAADAAADLKKAMESAKKEFGKTPHAILAQVGSSPPDAPEGYVVASATKQEATDWRIYVPKDVRDKMEECYAPADNAKIKEFSDRIPIVARFVFHKKDFR